MFERARDFFEDVSYKTFKQLPVTVTVWYFLLNMGDPFNRENRSKLTRNSLILLAVAFVGQWVLHDMSIDEFRIRDRADKRSKNTMT